MTYCCVDCGFLFRRVGEVQSCPLCESTRLCPATAQEAAQMHQLLDQTSETRKKVTIT